MSFDPNASSRRFQEQARKTHERAREQAKRSRDAYKVRAEGLEKQRANRARRRRTQQAGRIENPDPLVERTDIGAFPGDVDFEEEASRARSLRQRRMPRLRKMIIVIVAVACAVWLVATFPSDHRTGPASNEGVHGSVGDGTWNLRAGPSAKSESLGEIHSGHSVIVICVEAGWAKLRSPLDGAYVSFAALRLERAAPVC